jgi:hypothetical protein
MREETSRTASVATFVVCFVFLAVGTALSQQDPVPDVRRAVSSAVSSPLRDLAKLPPPIRYIASENSQPARITQAIGDLADPIEQISSNSGSNFSIDLNFLGLGNGFPTFTPSSIPPDANLAVGDTEVVQWVNPVFAVFDKSTGQLDAGPLLGNTIWTSLPGPCASGTSGTELIVQWDKAHHRWLLAENAVSGPPYYSCVAVSTSADALGTYYLYQFAQGSLLPASPKWAVWSNGYYQAQGEFSGTGFVGPQLCAYNSAKLVAGDGSAEQICFVLSPADGLPLPADIDSIVAPPTNEDEFFMSLWDSSHLSLYSLHPDYQNPQNSTVTGNNGSQLKSVPAFTPACNGNYGGECVPQKSVSARLLVLGDRLMYRLAYWEDNPETSVKANPPRPLPSQHWYVLHDATASGGNEAPRWYEFTAPIRAVPVTDIALFQSGTFAPDSNYRWMGSIARDKKYDILMGYSESSSNMYPSIAVTGRVLTDPLGTMESELVVVAGTGAQPDSSGHWGNYSTMRIDSDGCTFWYTTEYYMLTAPSDWSTQIASLKFAGCQ